MEIKAKLSHLRMSPRKVRLVVDIVRTMPVDKALDQLQFINKKAAAPIAKLIKSGIANAENTYSLEKDNLYIKAITVDEGVTLKRWMPRAHGRATTIRKRASHINLVLAEIKESGKKAKKTVKAEAPVKLDQLGEKKAKEAKKEEKKESKAKSKETVDAKVESHPKAEGGSKGFSGKVFRRKSG